MMKNSIIKILLKLTSTFFKVYVSKNYDILFASENVIIREVSQNKDLNVLNNFFEN